MAFLTVGQNQQYATLSSAVAASHDGDTIYVQAGTYFDDSTTVNTKISIVGVGGMASFVATQAPSNGKGILVTRNDVSIDHLELSGAAVAAGNGAGVRYELGKLTITNSYIHDNQNGIRGAAVAGGVINVDRTEFDHNGAGDGQSHNIYIGNIANFQMTNSFSHDAVVGHEVKSRAQTTILTNNRIFDDNGSASYSVDLPNGGNATIQNNVIQQGPYSQNPAIIAYAKESVPYAGSKLLVSGNTILSQLSGPSVYAVSNASSLIPQITGNHFFGLTSAQITNKASVQSGNDWLSSYPSLDMSHPWTASAWDKLISGGTGNDALSGSTGKDLFVGGAGADMFKAGVGADTVADFSLSQGDKIDVSGIAGYTSLSTVLSHMTQNLADTVIDLGVGNSLTLKNVAGTTLTASAFLFSASSGTSTPAGSGTTSTGTSGSDTLAGGSGADTLAGGLGNDTYIVNSAGDVVIENTGQGTDIVRASIDYTLPANVEKLFYTGSSNFTGTGNALNNTITGGAANNILIGLSGNDTLTGSSGDDSLAGGSGNDWLLGRGGTDTLSGGSGADHFILRTAADSPNSSARDIIVDFNHAEADKIDLANIDANAAITDNQAFTFIGTQSFHHSAGELHYTAATGGVIVSGDANGDGIADFSIDVQGATSLLASDFVL